MQIEIFVGYVNQKKKYNREIGGVDFLGKFIIHKKFQVVEHLFFVKGYKLKQLR